MKPVKKLKMINCLHCGGEMPSLRKSLYGYTTCVKCSSVKAYGCVAISNHKTGNEIQILPADVAANINRLSQRKGYGVLSGMKHN